MHRSLVIILTLGVLTLSAASGHAADQPRPLTTSNCYLIPDIGTPGMNTYVELVGPYDVDSYFGAPGVYLNNSGDNLQLKCVNAADTDKIKIGPLVVSWKGRTVASQIFVLPWVQPNSDDWNALTAGFRIPVVFSKGGQQSNVVTFYIVRPHAAINASAVAVLGSGGALGTRSPRGAMLVDSVILSGNGTISASTTDCDPNTPGNQGYLPFILLSKGPVTMSAGITVDVSATGKNGGPGGGGGGCGDGPPNEIGGSGYAGGGSGELKRPATGGDGTGGVGGNAGGGALNGLPGSPEDAMVCQSAGGSGNPFVTTSGGWYDPPNQLHDGCGPGGGFATAGDYGRGEYFPTPNFWGGKANGNRMLVPLMGGSGGGGGNEICSYAAAGTPGFTGGGGGGAIVCYGRSLFISNMISNGGMGVSSGVGCVNHGSFGGGGSGGAVALMAKLPSTFGTISLRGAAPGHVHPGSGGGGSGRLRIDGPSIATALFSPTDISVYRGISTDTSQYVPRTFTLTGSANGNAVQIYLRALNGPWQQIATVSGYGGFSWQKSITLPGCDSLYLLAASQTVPLPSTVAELLEPSFVMSQAAANFLYTTGGADLTVTAQPFRNLICDSITDTVITIKNLCTTDIVIDAITISQLGNDFSFVPPLTLPFTLRGGKDTTITIRFSRNTAGTATTTISVHSLSPIQKTIDVLMVGRRTATGALTVTSTQFTPPICDSVADGSIKISNPCGAPVTIDSLVLTQNKEGFSFVGLSFPIFLKGNSDTTIPIHFAPVTGGNKTAVVFIMINGDPQPAFTVGLFGSRNNSGAAIAATVDNFPTLVCDSTIDTLLHISNPCGADLIIDSLYFTPANSGFTFPPPLTLPVIVHGGKDTTLVVRFTRTVSGTSNATLHLRSNASNKSILNIPVAGKRDVAGLVGNSLDFGTLDLSQLPTTGMVGIRNTGTVPITITAAMFPNTSAFTVISNLPVIIPPGGTTLLVVQFNDPGTDLPVMDSLRLVCSPGCAIIDVEVRGQRYSPSQPPIIRSLQSRLFATQVCQSVAPDSVWIHNIGTSDLKISSPTFEFGSGGFVLVAPTTFPTTIKPNDSVLFVVQFNAPGGTAGTYRDTLLVPSNDSITGHSPWRIAYEATKDSASFSLSPMIIDCGTFCPSTTFDTTLSITNTGTTALVAFGSIAPPFQIATNRWPLVAGAVQNIALHLSGTSEGMVSDTLWVTDTLCNRTASAVIRANIAAPHLVIDVPLVTAICSPVDSLIEIKNTGLRDAVITGISVNDTAFHLSGMTVPFRLRAGDSISIPFQFFPKDTGTRSATITLSDTPCPAVISVPMIGRRVIPQATLSMPPFARMPGDTVLVPITLQSVVPPFLNPMVRVHLRFDKRLLVPIRGVGGTIVVITPGELIFTSDSQDATGSVGAIVFRVMTSHSDSAGILIDSMTLNGCDVAVTSQPVQVQVLPVCKDTMNVLFEGTSALMPITPNPFSTTMRVQYQTRTASHTRISAYDMLGRCVQVLVDRDELPGERSIDCDARGWSAGMYVVVLEAGTALERRWVVLER